jgi:hypothetical protein
MSDQALPPPPPLDALAPPDAGPPPEPLPVPIQVALQGWTPRPLLGPILWAYGVGLWAFVALGQFTTERAPWSSKVPLGGAAAGLWLLAISVAVLVHAQRTGLSIPTERWRRPMRIAIVTFSVLFLWAFTGFTSALMGSVIRGNNDGFVTLVLLAFAIAMTVVGRGATRALLPRPQGHQRLAAFGLFALGGLFTLLVVLQLG